MEEENPAFWNRKAAEALKAAKRVQPIQTSAKNLIILMGDGECIRETWPPWDSRTPGTQGPWWAKGISPGHFLLLQGWGCPQ